MPHSLAPALTRGIEILRLLEGNKAMTVDEIHRVTGTPKSSLRRILEVLEQLGCAGRDGSSAFHASVRLLPMEATSPGLDIRVAKMLEELAARTGLAAEWYVPAETGMVLARRRVPMDGEVRVQAKIGFIRAWGFELEAVCAVGRAFFGDRFASAGGRGPGWQYCDGGERTRVTRAEVARRVKQAAREGISADGYFNSNGVRRMAAVVMDGDSPAGVIALAEVLTPGADRQAEYMEELRGARAGM